METRLLYFVTVKISNCTWRFISSLLVYLNSAEDPHFYKWREKDKVQSFFDECRDFFIQWEFKLQLNPDKAEGILRQRMHDRHRAGLKPDSKSGRNYAEA